MTATALLTVKDVEKFSHEEMTKLLHASGIYRLDAHGWKSYDEEDPDHIGHAMAQTQSLSFHYLEEVMNKPNPPTLAGWQKDLIVAGGEFEGFMETARLSMGLMLLHAGSLDFFPGHFMSSMFFLGAASDRLRDFFVAAVFQRRPVQWKPHDHEAGQFITYEAPFAEALARKTSGMHPAHVDSLREMQDYIRRIAKHRQARHAIAHKIATEEGRREYRLVTVPRSPPVEDIDWEQIDWSKVVDVVQEDRKQYRARAAEPIDWYKVLIEASNHIYIVENGLRAMQRLRPS